MTQEKKKRPNRRNEEKLLLANREPNNLFKAQQKKKSISITEKANIFNQITNGDEAAQKFNLYGCQQKKNRKKKKNNNSVPRDQKDKGVLVSNNTEQMDVDVPMATHFQDEILMNILKRLPVRSLCQFKCVSKFWKTLISDSYFKMMHLNRAKNDQNSQKLLIAQCCPKDYTYSMYCLNLSSDQPVENVRQLDSPYICRPYRLAITCCYDGLAIIFVNDNIDVTRNIYLLWNPSTGESVMLPDPQFPDFSGLCMGLGYDSTSGDYKIVATYPKCPGEILTLRSGSWRYIDKHPRGISSFNGVMHHLPFVNGAFHWIGMLGHFMMAATSRGFSLVTFGISNEVYGEILLPEQLLCLRGVSFGVSVLGGMLCVYCNCNPRGTNKFWILKDYGIKEYWTSLLTIEDPLSLYVAVPKYRFADGELLYWSLTSEGTLGHAFRTRNGPFGLWPQCGIVQSGLAFTESLISPKSLI